MSTRFIDARPKPSEKDTPFADFVVDQMHKPAVRNLLPTAHGVWLAVALLSERGEESITPERVARLVGISPSTATKHFRDLAALGLVGRDGWGYWKAAR